MKKALENLSVERMQTEFNLSGWSKTLDRKHFILIRQQEEANEHAPLNQPFRMSEGRAIHVLGGEASYRINLVDMHLAKGDFIVFPSGTIVEVLQLSSDFVIEAIAALDFPGVSSDTVRAILPEEVLHLHLDEKAERRVNDYFHLITLQLSREVYSKSSVSFLILSLIADMNKIERQKGNGPDSSGQPRSREIFGRFLALLKQYGTTQRNVPFYATELALTPNHLSAVIRQESGLSVMDWINRTCVTEAKVLLKHSDLMIYEIADHLSFPEATAFNRYFKHQTGMTPLEYRNI